MKFLGEIKLGSEIGAYAPKPLLQNSKEKTVFDLFCSVLIGLKKSRHFLSQSEAKPKPIVTRLRTFSRASRRLHVTASSFDWFTGLSVSFLTGHSDYSGFGCTTFN